MRAALSLVVTLLLVAGGVRGAAPGASFQPREEPGTPDPLADSELFYTASGGLAGTVREARLIAKAGGVTVEYSASDHRGGAARLTGVLEPSRYLIVWQEAERLGIWTLAVPGKAKGADLIQQEIRVRAGTRSHTVRWTDVAASSPSARTAAQIGERILAVAREATTER